MADSSFSGSSRRSAARETGRLPGGFSGGFGGGSSGGGFRPRTGSSGSRRTGRFKTGNRFSGAVAPQGEGPPIRALSRAPSPLWGGYEAWWVRSRSQHQIAHHRVIPAKVRIHPDTLPRRSSHQDGRPAPEVTPWLAPAPSTARTPHPARIAAAARAGLGDIRGRDVGHQRCEPPAGDRQYGEPRRGRVDRLGHANAGSRSIWVSTATALAFLRLGALLVLGEAEGCRCGRQRAAAGLPSPRRHTAGTAARRAPAVAALPGDLGRRPKRRAQVRASRADRGRSPPPPGRRACRASAAPPAVPPVPTPSEAQAASAAAARRPSWTDLPMLGPTWAKGRG